MNVHRLRQRVEIERAPLADQNQNAQLRQRDPVFDLGHRLHGDADQRLSGEHHRIDLLRGDRAGDCL